MLCVRPIARWLSKSQRIALCRSRCMSGTKRTLHPESHCFESSSSYYFLSAFVVHEGLADSSSDAAKAVVIDWWTKSWQETPFNLISWVMAGTLGVSRVPSVALWHGRLLTIILSSNFRNNGQYALDISKIVQHPTILIGGSTNDWENCTLIRISRMRLVVSWYIATIS